MTSSNCLLGEFSSNCIWISANTPNSSIELAFAPHIAKVTKYSLTIIENYYPFTEWIVEGSKDSIHYTTLEHVKKEDNKYMCTEFLNNDKLCKGNSPYIGTLSQPQLVMFLRVTSLGKRIDSGSSGLYALPLSNIAVYGNFYKGYFFMTKVSIISPKILFTTIFFCLIL